MMLMSVARSIMLSPLPVTTRNQSPQGAVLSTSLAISRIMLSTQGYFSKSSKTHGFWCDHW